MRTSCEPTDRVSPSTMTAGSATSEAEAMPAKAKKLATTKSERRGKACMKVRQCDGRPRQGARTSGKPICAGILKKGNTSSNLGKQYIGQRATGSTVLPSPYPFLDARRPRILNPRRGSRPLATRPAVAQLLRASKSLSPSRAMPRIRFAILDLVFSSTAPTSAHACRKTVSKTSRSAALNCLSSTDPPRFHRHLLEG
jgi:hypothetical protein